MDDVPTRLLKDILYASKNRLITVTNTEYASVINRIEIFLSTKEDTLQNEKNVNGGVQIN